MFLRALINLDPYSFVDDVAEHFAAQYEDNDKSAEQILLATVDGLAEDQLTSLALRLVLTGSLKLPDENQVDSSAEIEAVFVPAQAEKKRGAMSKKSALVKEKQQTATKTRKKGRVAA